MAGVRSAPARQRRLDRVQERIEKAIVLTRMEVRRAGDTDPATGKHFFYDAWDFIGTTDSQQWFKIRLTGQALFLTSIKTLNQCLKYEIDSVIAELEKLHAGA